MRKIFFKKSFYILSIFLLLIGLPAYAPPLTSWSGALVGGVDDVTNQNITIDGDCTINGTVTIEASGGLTVNVDVATVDRKMTGIVNDPWLDLYVAGVSDEIIFNVTNDLMFTGDTDTPLRILVRGSGTVKFVLSNGKKVQFTSSDANSEGTKLYVLMDNSVELQFSRDNTNSTANVEVVVGPKSVMSYVAPTTVSSGSASESGLISFRKVGNSDSGRTILRIKDTGLVYVGGNKWDAGLPWAVDMTVPAGNLARLLVRNDVGAFATAGLLIINENETLPSYLINPWLLDTPFDGVRYGFILGANAEVQIGVNAYIDYVALGLNVCPEPSIPDEILNGRTVAQVVKSRNPSAFIVDGNPDVNATPARIEINDGSALFFRSGVDDEGTVNEGNFDFTIDPTKETAGMGQIVFDVEGELRVVNSAGNNKIEILSWHVGPTGGPILIGGSETIFPLRSFNKTGDDYDQYNSACFLINNRVRLENINLVHTDKNHSVYEKDDVRSEPTYVGGETFVIEGTTDRPKIAFYNSNFMIHTCVALTGLDLFVPSISSENNISYFTFYHNGFAFRDGTGRQMILGTQVGSTGCDPCCAAISKDAHLDVFQDLSDAGLSQFLYLNTAANDETITDGLTGDISGEAEIHTIYLGHASNISVGSETNPGFALTAFPTFFIEGNYFSFETRGGSQSSPETSSVTGEGGIFVDENGVFGIQPGYRANISVMVTKSKNGVVSLPLSQVFFDNRVGIADWQVDLTDPAQRVLVAADESVSDYTMNWRDVTKDWSTSETVFIPYDVPDVDPCDVPAVTINNIASLPSVEGMVEQFQIKGSRLGSPAHLLVDGGLIRELIFLEGCDSADVPTAVLVLKNYGRVGLGSKHKNIDSLSGSVVLGVNGITIIADGDGSIDVNEDIIINNICHVLRGPNFSDGVSDKLTFYSDCCRSITVKKGGVLDLSTFVGETKDGGPDIIELAGNLKLILEEGAKVVLGGCNLVVKDNARIESSEVKNIATFSFGSDVTSTDEIRVKFIGTGTVTFLEDASFFVGDNSFVGIETDSCYTTETSLLFEFGDRSQMLIGSKSGVNNSVFQVGNTTDQEATVVFGLNLSGVDSLCQIASRGFLGLGVGMIDNFFTSPSNWLVDTLYNVEAIEIYVPAGTFAHERVFDSDSPYASLLAINSAIDGFIFDYESPITLDTTQATILGGGNMALITEDDGLGVNPTVQETDGEIAAGRLSVGLFSSKAILDTKVAPVGAITGTALFNFWKTPDFATFVGGYSNASQDEHNLLSLGYIDGGNILRGLVDELVGQGGITVARKDFEHTLSLGSVSVELGPTTLPAPRTPLTVFELP